MPNKNLVLFYSWSGNTGRIAQIIAEKTGADLRELQPETDYSPNYNEVLAQAKGEIQQQHYPALRPIDMDWNAYETVYLGTPNWWSTVAPPVMSFLWEVMPTEKTIMPFCTHGGGGEGEIAHVVRAHCIGCDVMPLLSIQEDGGTQAERLVEQWLKRAEP
ncbi:MAG: flavodoxin [Ruminococcus flavefaciens]|nr:flavodoxin [Ruminococcus flavefaciens]